MGIVSAAKSVVICCVMIEKPKIFTTWPFTEKNNCLRSVTQPWQYWHLGPVCAFSVLKQITPDLKEHAVVILSCVLWFSSTWLWVPHSHLKIRLGRVHFQARSGEQSSRLRGSRRRSSPPLGTQGPRHMGPPTGCSHMVLLQGQQEGVTPASSVVRPGPRSNTPPLSHSL